MNNTNGPPGNPAFHGNNTAAKVRRIFTASSGAIDGNVAARNGPNTGDIVTNNSATASPGAGFVT